MGTGGAVHAGGAVAAGRAARLFGVVGAGGWMPFASSGDLGVFGLLSHYLKIILVSHVSYDLMVCYGFLHPYHRPHHREHKVVKGKIKYSHRITKKKLSSSR